MGSSPGGRTTCTPARIPANASNVTVLAANARRNGVVFFNDGSTAVNLKFGATASATDYTYQIASNAGWIPDASNIYQGRIDAIWSGSPTGGLQVSEW